MYQIFFLHLSVDGLLPGCFHILAIVINIGVHISLWVSVFGFFFFFFFDIYSGVEMPGHVVVLFLGFWETSLLFSIVAAPVYIPAISIPFLHILTNIYIQ